MTPKCLPYSVVIACGFLGRGLWSASDTIYDNGLPNYDGGYSNAVDFNGFRRTLLDDFVIPKDEVWSMTGLHHFAIWNTMKPGTGIDFELAIRADESGSPGDVLTLATSVSYREDATGQTVFGRPEYQSWYEFEEIQLSEGVYWIEGTVVGPVNENNFWLIIGNGIFNNSECWVNYEDLGGLQSGTMQFHDVTDLNFQLIGTVIGACRADFDDSGRVDFADLLALLSAWGPCDHPADCPVDLNNDGVVDFDDLLTLLAAWGPCS